MKKENIYILCRHDHKNYKRKIEARTFVKNEIKFAIIGNSYDGFNLTFVDNGMSILYAEKLKDIMNIIDEVVFKIKNSNQVFLENAKKLFDEAEIEGE
jgi:hypothetical protein